MVAKTMAAGTELPSAAGVLGVLWHVALVGMFVVNRIDYVTLYDKTSPSHRSLLGADFGLPILLSNHRSYPPQPPQDYHHDGDAPFSHELHQLQVFYMPQATSEEMGPLELCAHHSPSSAFRPTCLSRLGCGRLPGSHFVPTTRGIDQPAVKATGPAGTVIISDYAILHRRSGSEGRR